MISPMEVNIDASREKGKIFLNCPKEMVHVVLATIKDALELAHGIENYNNILGDALVKRGLVVKNDC